MPADRPGSAVPSPGRGLSRAPGRAPPARPGGGSALRSASSRTPGPGTRPARSTQELGALQPLSRALQRQSGPQPEAEVHLEAGRLRVGDPAAHGSSGRSLVEHEARERITRAGSRTRGRRRDIGRGGVAATAAEPRPGGVAAGPRGASGPVAGQEDEAAVVVRVVRCSVESRAPPAAVPTVPAAPADRDPCRCPGAGPRRTA